MAESGEKREKAAKEYDALHNRLFLFQLLTFILLLAVYQFSGASASLAEGLESRFGGNRWYITNAVYTAISVFGFTACLMPFSFYGGYVLEHHYGLSRQPFGGWLADFLKSLCIELILAALFFSVVYALLRWSLQWWWLAGALFYILFSVGLSTIAPVVILPLFHRFEPLKEGPLTSAARKMMQDEGIKIAGIFKWGLKEKTAAANAAFTGCGKTRRIILGDTLLSNYTQDEILAILAHEIGHYKNRDIWRLTAVGSILALFGFFVAHHCLNGLTSLFGMAYPHHIATAPLLVFSLFVFSLLSMPLTNLHSRWREFAADAFAVKKMDSPEALISSLEKLAEQNLSNKEPAAWIEFLLHSHPSIGRRISRIRR